MTISARLKEQIEAAFDYRGHVTLTLTDGRSVEGFLFNRYLGGEKRAEAPYVEVMLKGSAERQRFEVSELAAVALTGEDAAAGKSYADYLEKKEAEAKLKKQG